MQECGRNAADGSRITATSTRMDEGVRGTRPVLSSSRPSAARADRAFRRLDAFELALERAPLFLGRRACVRRQRCASRGLLRPAWAACASWGGTRTSAGCAFRLRHRAGHRHIAVIVRAPRHVVLLTVAPTSVSVCGGVVIGPLEVIASMWMVGTLSSMSDSLIGSFTT